MKKFGLRLTGRRKWYFLIFAFSLYPNFKLLLSKILKWILRVLSNFYYVTNIFELHFFFFFEICSEMHFVSLFFSKWKKHNLPFEDTFKMYCCALCYLKFKFQKQDLKLQVFECAISFFRFHIFFILIKLLSKADEITIIF